MKFVARPMAAVAALALLSAGQYTAFAEPSEGSAEAKVGALGVRDSASLSTPVVVGGAVRDAKGVPSGGADVVLMAWPSNDVVEKLAVGDKLALQPVATAVTAADGSFEVRLDSNERVRPMAGSDGIVNFEIVASAADSTSGRSGSSFNFARKLAESDAGPVLADVNTPDGELTPAAPTEVQLTYDGTVTEVNPEPQMPLDESATVIETNPAPLQKSGDIVCDITYVVPYGPKWVHVGQTYNVASYMHSEFTYLRGSSSTLGTGISTTGKAGTFSANGTTSRSSTSTWEFGSAAGTQKRYFDTQFQFGKYEHKCYDSGSGYQWIYYTVRTNGFVGGTRIQKLNSAPAADHCVRLDAGTGFIKDEARAGTWSGGVEFPGMGMGFSATTGYNSNSRIYYKALHLARRVCGTNAVPDKARIVVAK